jgi:hypothetical protein
MQPSRNLSAVAAPLYSVAIMLIVVPIIEVGTQLEWSASPGTLNWRTGAVGLISGGTLTPTFGLVVAIVTASAFEHRWTQRFLIALAGLAALASFALLLTFALDSIQLRASVIEAMLRPYTLAVIKAGANLALTSVALTVVGVGAYRARSKTAARSVLPARDAALVARAIQSEA